MTVQDLQRPMRRGASAVGVVADLDAIEAASVIYLRLWCGGQESRSVIEADFTEGLGQIAGREALASFDDLCRMCVRHGRRPLMHHGVQCVCVGSDEACFANFIATAIEGEREDALMIATLIVRTDVAPLITALATRFGLALKRMKPKAPRDIGASVQHSQQFH